MFSSTRCIGGAVRPRAFSNGQLESFRAEHSLNVNSLRVDAASASRPPSSTSHRRRSFHTSPRVSYDSTSYNVTDVPDFFVKYKQERATCPADSDMHGRPREGSGLMLSLTGSILSGDVVATTRRLGEKIPVEHQTTDGRTVHSSGYIVPGPGHFSTSDVARAKESERDEKRDLLAQTASIARRVREYDLEHVDAKTLPSLHKVPFEVRELDGSVKHASGFVPPTPSHKFKHTVPSKVHWERKASAVRQAARQPSPSRRAVLRAVHTSSTPLAHGEA